MAFSSKSCKGNGIRKATPERVGRAVVCGTLVGAVLSVVLLRTESAWGLSLVDFKTGARAESDELLRQGRVLVVVEKDCRACQHYAERLKSCEPTLRDSVAFVSTSTPTQTKTVERGLPPGSRLYIPKSRQDLERLIKATPTTLTRGGSTIGPLTCDQLRELRAPLADAAHGG